MIDTGFVEYLGTLTDAPVQQNTISEDYAKPFVWFRRRSANVPLYLDGTPYTIKETFFDVEVIGEDLDEVQELTETLKLALNGHRGTWDGTVVAGCWVSEHNDDYIYKNMDADAGLHVASFETRVMHY